MKTVTEKVYGNRFYATGDEGPPERLVEFVDWLCKLFISIPAEYQETARIEIRSDEYAVEMSISYERPETKEEMFEREHQVKIWQQQTEARERGVLANLLSKYPEMRR